MLGKYVLDDGHNIIYIGIMKALAEEKAEDWASDNWKDYPQVTITSDFRGEEGFEKRVDEARIICITPESLASRLRRMSGDPPAWARNAGLIVIDEVHLLADGERGANMEAAIIEFCHKFPNCRVVGLSATVPNVDQIANWVTTLTGAPTDVVRSDFRPVPIVEEFLPFTPLSNATEDTEAARNKIIVSLVNDATKYKQQFLVCVFSKAYGRRLLDVLKSNGVTAEFHNADIADRTKRKKIEEDFKAGRLRVLISTSTLFTGVNLPARNVIITSVKAGLDNVPVYTLKQAAGRAGRPKYDTEGDVFYLINSQEFLMQQTRIIKGEPINSQLANRVMLASHVVGAIHMGRISNPQEFDTWYAHTLAFEQGVKSVEQITKIRDTVIDNLKRMGVLFVKEEGGKVTYKLTRIGVITAQMYLDPYHFTSALQAIKRYSLLSNPTESDFIRAMSMWEGYSQNPPSFDERLAMHPNTPSVPDQFKKVAAVITYRVSGQKVPGVLTSTNGLIYNDINRMQAAISRAVQETKAIDISQDRLDIMFSRVISQCSWEQASMAVQKFSKKERDRLTASGIMTFQQAKANVALAVEILGKKRADELGINVGRDNSDGTLRFGKNK
jgi:replicative superfamily II helicase